MEACQQAVLPEVPVPVPDLIVYTAIAPTKRAAPKRAALFGIIFQIFCRVIAFIPGFHRPDNIIHQDHLAGHALLARLEPAEINPACHSVPPGIYPFPYDVVFSRVAYAVEKLNDAFSRNVEDIERRFGPGRKVKCDLG